MAVGGVVGLQWAIDDGKQSRRLNAIVLIRSRASARSIGDDVDSALLMIDEQLTLSLLRLPSWPQFGETLEGVEVTRG